MDAEARGRVGPAPGWRLVDVSTYAGNGVNWFPFASSDIQDHDIIVWACAATAKTPAANLDSLSLYEENSGGYFRGGAPAYLGTPLTIAGLSGGSYGAAGVAGLFRPDEPRIAGGWGNRASASSRSLWVPKGGLVVAAVLQINTYTQPHPQDFAKVGYAGHSGTGTRYVDMYWKVAPRDGWYDHHHGLPATALRAQMTVVST